MKGEGDGQRSKYLLMLSGRPAIFAFYRAMQAYEKALIGGETSTSPDSDFFKFFGKSIAKYKDK